MMKAQDVANTGTFLQTCTSLQVHAPPGHLAQSSYPLQVAQYTTHVSHVVGCCTHCSSSLCAQRQDAGNASGQRLAKLSAKRFEWRFSGVGTMTHLNSLCLTSASHVSAVPCRQRRLQSSSPPKCVTAPYLCAVPCRRRRSRSSSPAKCVTASPCAESGMLHAGRRTLGGSVCR